MEQQEKKVIADIKKMAKLGQMVRITFYQPTIVRIQIKLMNGNVCGASMRGLGEQIGSGFEPSFLP